MDLGSSNVTFVYDQGVEGEVFAYHHDKLRFDTVEYKLLDHEAPHRVKQDAVDPGTFLHNVDTQVRPTSTIMRPMDTAAADQTKQGNE